MRDIRPPRGFRPPQVKDKRDGPGAVKAYEWYFEGLRKDLSIHRQIFLMPCTKTKPYAKSPLYRQVYLPYACTHGSGMTPMVISDAVGIVRYGDTPPDVSGTTFMYEFAPRMLTPRSRAMLIGRIREILSGRDVYGCLPRHHAELVTSAIGVGWKNYWCGDLMEMKRRAARLQ